MAESRQQHQKGRNHALRRPVHESDPDNHRGIAGLERCRSAPCFHRSRPIHIVAIFCRTNYDGLDVEAVSNRPCNSDKRCGQRAAINHCDPVRSAGKVPGGVQVTRELKCDPGLVVLAPDRTIKSIQPRCHCGCSMDYSSTFAMEECLKSMR